MPALIAHTKMFMRLVIVARKKTKYKFYMTKVLFVLRLASIEKYSLKLKLAFFIAVIKFVHLLGSEITAIFHCVKYTHRKAYTQPFANT